MLSGGDGASRSETQEAETSILDTSLAALKELPCERFPNNRSAVYFEVGRGPTGLVVGVGW